VVLPRCTEVPRTNLNKPSEPSCPPALAFKMLSAFSTVHSTSWRTVVKVCGAQAAAGISSKPAIITWRRPTAKVLDQQIVAANQVVASIFNEVCVLVTAAFALTLVPGFRQPERSSRSRRNQGKPQSMTRRCDFTGMMGLKFSSSMCGNVVMVGTGDDVVPFGDFLVEGLGLLPVMLQRVGA
jgi:hypothetical protein